MLPFLSPEWVGALDEALSGNDELRSAAAGTRLTVSHRVHGAPGGDASYRIVLDQGRCRAVHDRGPADVRFVEDYATAAALSRGTATVPQALMAGRLKVSGDVAALARHGPLLTLIGRVLAPVRERTSYP